MPRANERNADGTLHHTQAKKAAKDKGLNIMLSELQFNRVTSMAELLGVTKSELARSALTAYLGALEKSKNLKYNVRAGKYDKG